MSAKDQQQIAALFKRLHVADVERLAAIDGLRELGVVRSKGLVADYGEHLASVYYDVELADKSTKGYDLKTQDGRQVQVKTLRSATNHRRSVGPMKDPYDTLLAIRLGADYAVLHAIEIPRGVVETHYQHGQRVAIADRLERDPGVRRIEAVQLLTRAAGCRRNQMTPSPPSTEEGH